MRKKIIFIYMIIFLHHHNTYSFWPWRQLLGLKTAKISPKDFDALDQEIDDMTHLGYLEKQISELKVIHNDIKNFETNYEKKKRLEIVNEGKMIDEAGLDFKITNVISLLQCKYDNLKEQNEKYNEAIEIIKKYHNKSNMTNRYKTHLGFLIALQIPVIESLEEVHKSLEEEKQKAKMYSRQYNTQPDTELLTQSTIQDNNEIYEFKEKQGAFNEQ